MPSQYQKDVCQCTNSQRFSSVFLVFSIIFPKFSCAQIPNAVPTTFITSAIPPSSTPHISNLRRQISSSTNPDGEDSSRHVYNYYFVIVAVFVVIVFFLLLYITQRRKRKALLIRNNGQTALARDVQSFADFRTRFGPRRAGTGLMGMTMGSVAANRERQEGLDERGEAPPAYVEGDKPPSLRSEDGVTMVVSREDHANENGASSVSAVGAETTNNSLERNISSVESRLSAELSRPSATTASNSARRTSIGGSSTPITSAADSSEEVGLRPLSRSTSARPPLGPPTYSETYLGGQPDITRPAAVVTHN
ncbi:uncharacterized protein EAF01_010264 [Botrytis porri]|uniref:Uncharacterized protein n=1 Tax=Botrytis porri TaxID=87229 RepID=A0A4Z1KS79_9HELO|nr:uncharacterized protein EAF01_010264 [Botrytis porri]KAF7892184.1 hypothetical protein EAF01_010264 [Botrytis porri]TGO85395.1 hypothetical protein BPOR_0400g00040 [Botrytis porri]